MAGNETFTLARRNRAGTGVQDRLAELQSGAPMAGAPTARAPQTLEDVSSETGVPWNVLQVVVDDAVKEGAVGDTERVPAARHVAGRLKEHLDGGADMPTAMRNVFGKDAPVDDALARALALAGAEKPSDTQNNDNTALEDAGRAFVGSAISGVGSIAEGVGTLLDVDDLIGDPGVTDWAATAGIAVADTLRGWGKDVKDGMSADAKKAMRRATPEGRIFQPSTWKFDGMSAEGITMLTADVLGSLAPVVVAAIFTTPMGAAAVGGAQAGGEGAATAREIVDRADEATLAEHSAFYNEMRERGLSHEAAKERVKDASSSLAGVLTGAIGGFGGAFTGALVKKGLPGVSTAIGSRVAGAGVGARVGATAAVGALEEGVQETAEGVAARGTTAGVSGLPVDVMEGTLAEFVLGALAGGVVGGASGLAKREEEDDPSRNRSVVGSEAADMPPPAPSPTPAPADLTSAPSGPLTRAARAAGPAPVEPVVTGEPGQTVRITTPEGTVIDATLDGVDERGAAKVKVDGVPMLLTPERIAAQGLQVEALDPLTEAEWGDIRDDEITPATFFPAADETSEPPARREERLTAAIERHLAESGAEGVFLNDIQAIINDINRYGGTAAQAVGDFLLEEEAEARAIDAEARAASTAPAGDPQQGTALAPTPGALPPAADAGTVARAWDAMDQQARSRALVEVGFKDAAGALNGPGRRASAKGWDALSERVREKLGEQIGAVAQDPAESVRIKSEMDAEPGALPPPAPPRQQPGVNELPPGTIPIALAAEETAPEPTEAQKEAENYKTGKAAWNGLRLSVENKKGSERSKKTPDGQTAWSVTMPAHYGRILRTEGADGDHVDFYMGDNEASESVWVIDQMDADTGRFDEHKVMLGFDDAMQASETYRAGFSDGRGGDRLGGIRKMDVAGFKEWLASGNTKAPITPKAKRQDTEAQAAGTPPTTIPPQRGEQGTPPVVDGEPAPDEPQGDLSSTDEPQGEAGETAPEPVNPEGSEEGADGGETISDTPQEAPQEPEAPKEKIEDFGEKIGGARKDKAKAYAERLTDLTDPEDLVEGKQTLADLIPEPDFAAMLDNGMDPRRVAAIAVLRAGVRRKPARNYEKRRWAEEVLEARDKITALMAGKGEPEDSLPQSMFASEREAQHDANALLLDAIAKLDPSDYGLAGRLSYLDNTIGTEGGKARFYFAPNANFRRVSEGKDATELAAAFRSMFRDYRERQKESREAPYDFQFATFYNKRTGAGYVYATKPKRTQIESYPSIADASAALNDPEQRQALWEKAEAMRVGPRERRLANRERKGIERRKGNVTPKRYQNAFGFYGVEFGKYVTQRERQAFLNESYDALMDLAGAIGIDPKMLSLDGTLGMAFGARGQGARGRITAAAHYEPNGVIDLSDSASEAISRRPVINLTKGSGAGSLAHEWWHALDHYLGKLDHGSATENSNLYTDYLLNQFRRQQAGRLDKVVADAVEQTVRAIKRGDWHKRNKKADAMSSKPYYSTSAEETARLFEAAVVERLSDRDMHNDFLANIDGYAGAYPTTAEMGAIRAPMMEVIRSLAGILAVENGGNVPVMPPLRDDALSAPVDVGRKWNSPDGTREIVGRERSNGIDVFLVKTKGDEKTARAPADQIEQMIARDEYAASDEGKAEREKIERDAAQKAAKQAKRDAEQSAQSARLEAFMESKSLKAGSRKKMEASLRTLTRRGVSRIDLVESIMRAGGEIRKPSSGSKALYIASDGAGSTSQEEVKGNGISYARWFKGWMKAQDAAEAAREKIEATQSRLPEGYAITVTEDAKPNLRLTYPKSGGWSASLGSVNDVDNTLEKAVEEAERHAAGGIMSRLPDYLPPVGQTKRISRQLDVTRTESGVKVSYHGFPFYETMNPASSAVAGQRFIAAVESALNDDRGIAAKALPAFVREVRYQVANTTLPEGYQIEVNEQRVKLRGPDGDVKRDTLLVMEDRAEGIAEEMTQMRRIAEAGAATADPAPEDGTETDFDSMFEDLLDEVAPDESAGRADAAPDDTPPPAQDTTSDVARPDADPQGEWDTATRAQRESVFTAAGWTIKATGDLNEAAKRNVDRDYADLTPAAAKKVREVLVREGMFIGQALEVERARREAAEDSGQLPPRTAGEAAQSAAQNAGAGVNAALDGLINLFGGNDPNKLNAGLPFSRETYEAAKPMFLDAVRHFGAAGQDIRDVMRAVMRAIMARPGATRETLVAMQPYVTQFTRDVESGNIDLSTTQEPPNADSEVQSDPDAPLESASSEGAQGNDEGGNAGSGSQRPGGGNRGPRGGNGSAGDAGGRGNGSGAGRPVSEAGNAVSATTVPAADFQITPDLRLGQGTEGQKFSDNIAAIETLKKIEGERRRATADEQAILARYVGWGGLKNAFRVAGSAEGEGVAKGWEKRVAQVEALLTPEELRAARNSTTAAHYTSETITSGVWKIAERMGFSGGAVLEPSAGIGNFLGLMPDHLRGASRVMAVEYDTLTARIAKHLYPNQSVMHSGFQDVPLPENRFALAIGNPPFGREKLHFQHLPEANQKTIHNQFFIASMNALAPGGTLAMVVSRYVMDAVSSDARIALARKGQLVGAIRLPSSAFKENARTEVVTDILVFEKHTASVDAIEAGIAIAEGRVASPKISDEDAETGAALAEGFDKWLGAVQFNDPAGSGETLTMNRYFLANPDMVLGDISAQGTQNRSNDYTVTLPAEQLAQRLDDAIGRLPRRALKDNIREATEATFEALSEAMGLAVRRAEPGAIRIDDDGVLQIVSESISADGAPLLIERPLTADRPFPPQYYQKADGKWYQLVDVIGPDGKPVKQVNEEGKTTRLNQKVEEEADPSTMSEKSLWGQARVDRVREMLAIRDGFLNLVNLEMDGEAREADVTAARKALRETYRAFKKKHGLLHHPAIRKLANMMPDGALVLAVENLTSPPGAPVRSIKAEEADILSKRVFLPPAKIEKAENLTDAITVSLNEYGRLDVDRMSDLLGESREAVVEKLTAGQSPAAFFDPETRTYQTRDEYLTGQVRRKLRAAQEAGLEANVEALEAVAPAPWGAQEVTPTLGSNWIPRDVYASFLRHLGYSSASIIHLPLNNSFTVRAVGNANPQWRMSSDRAWGVDRLVQAVMSSSPIKVTYTVDEKTVVDEEATAEAKAMAEEIAVEFQDWVFTENERRDRLLEIFNDRFNTRVTRQRDGSHLTLPGSNPAINLRRHQKNAIWRSILDRVVLFDHVVGAGKTFAAIARVMERRRLGLARKPMVVVPNHLTEQWAEDWHKLYPGAKLLVATKGDFEKNNRRRLFARIASGDYDAVIIGHSQITQISIDPAIEAAYLEQELRDAQAGVKEAEEQAAEDGADSGWRKPMGVAEAERLVTKLQERLAKVRSMSRDRLITFQQMGVDDITIDEAHEFKNLSYSSRLTNTSGMGNKTGSGKAIDLHLKMRSLHDANAGIAFLTGTPISNSVSEMYLLLRNLAPDALAELGMTNFDAWRTMFVEASTDFEPTEAGGLKQVTRLGREWMNMRTLMDLYYSVSDSVTLDDIKGAYAQDNGGAPYPVPRIANLEKEGDARTLVPITPDDAQASILEDIIAGFDGLPGISNPKERNAERLRLMDRARKVSLDARAVDQSLRINGGGAKLTAMSENIARIYKKWDADKGTQVVFMDRSVPQAKGDKEFVAKYDAARAEYDAALAEGDEAKAGKAADKLEKFDENDVEARRGALAGRWNAYDELKDQLVAQGVPANEIRFVQEAASEVQKEALFADMRAGRVRVLIGSTPRMGAGTNVQARLVALHHGDVTWKPSDIEQREGRIIRQGNELLGKYGVDAFEVEVLAYATERTIDAKMWDLNGQKLRAINGIRKYTGDFNMEFEDAESASMAEMAALATGNPLMVERIKLDDQRKRLMRKGRAFSRKRNAMRAQIAAGERFLEGAKVEAERAEKHLAEAKAQKAEIDKRSAARSITIAGATFNAAPDALAAFNAEVGKQRAGKGKENARFKVKFGDDLTVTTQADAEKLISEAFGQPGFEATVDGKVYIDPRAAVAAVNDAFRLVLEQSPPQLETVIFDRASVMGFPLEISATRDEPGNAMSPLDVNSDVMLDGVPIASSGGFIADSDMRKGTPAALGIGAFRKMVGNISPEALEGESSRIAQKVKATNAELPALRIEVEKDWGQSDELEEVSGRLKEVIAELDSQSDDGNPNVREKRQPVLPDRRKDGQPLPATMRALKADLDARIDRLGLTGKVKVNAWRKITSGPMALEGFYEAGEIGISASDGTPIETLHHEIIHFLRDSAVWGGERGVFTPGEWRKLVRAARGDKAIMRAVMADYRDASARIQTEEAVAELYRRWQGRMDAGPVSSLLQRIKDVLEAIGNALRGNGFEAAGQVFSRIASGEIGGRGPDGPGQGRGASDARQKRIPSPRDAAAGLTVTARNVAQGSKQLVSDAVTNAMQNRGGYNTLALVPGRALLLELGAKIPAAKAYLRLKEKMDALRDEWHARTDDVGQAWRRQINKDKAANADMMQLMADATLAQFDPANPDPELFSSHPDLMRRWEALPPAFKTIYRKVRDQYAAMDKAMGEAIIDNVDQAMKVALDRATREHESITAKNTRRYEGTLARIDRMTDISAAERKGRRAAAKTARDEAQKEADEKLDRLKTTTAWSKDARLKTLRQQMERNRLKGPYFPLARFGDYFVLARDDLGDVVSFSKHQTVQEQRDMAEELEAEGYDVQQGVMSETELRDMVDPEFAADIVAMLNDVGADESLMDDVWQKWLTTLPDMSLRKRNIHRKGRPGYDADQFRGFGHHMFHGSHQLARLTYQMRMGEQLDLAKEQAAKSADPVRQGFIVNEMQRRHAYTMNPKGAWWATYATSAAFIYYLSVSPAAAVVNLSQTSINGMAVLGKHGGMKKAAGALTKAMADLARSKDLNTKNNTKNLTQEERDAIEEGDRRGVIQRTESHDLASIGESGVEYSAAWQNVMRKISWLFHHSERINREVTFLAAYRLLREQGADHETAITKAGDDTWMVHFDYQNCVDDQTEILTTTGWKRYDEVRAGDVAISTDDAGNAVETKVEDVSVFHRPQAVTLHQSRGRRTFSMATTSEHTNVVMKQIKRGGKMVWSDPMMVPTKDLDQSHNVLRSPLTPLARSGGKYGVEFARLLGWMAAEGWYARNRGAAEKKHSVRIEQSIVHNPDHVSEIQSTLDALGARHSRHVVKGGRHIFWSITGDMGRRVRAAMPDKLLTWEMVQEMDADEMAATLDAFAKADGTKRGKNGCITISQKRSTNRQNIDVLQAMCACLGKTASVGESKTRDTIWMMYPGNGRIQNRKTAIRNLEETTLDVPLVWCPTTGTGRWVARRNGHFFLTGNTSKPRFMQNPGMQVLMVFRNFVVNQLWRIFRDLHQSVKAESPEVRKEARRQAAAMASMMLFHAGIKGMYGYGLLMTLLGLFFPDDEDDPEERLEKIMLDYLPRPVAKAMLDGVPGTALGIDLTNRIGMPNLWFRPPLRPLEGEELYQHYLNEMLGAVPSIGMNFARGLNRIAEGASLDDNSLIWRGVETAMPKAFRDIMRGGRFAYEGALTYNGDPIKEEFSPWEIFAQVSGFSPRDLVDRYDQNGRLKRKESAISTRRSNVIKQVAEALRAGKTFSDQHAKLIEDYNRKYPEWPITPDTIRSSIRGRDQRAQRNEGGVSINPRLEPRLRATQSPLVAPE